MFLGQFDRTLDEKSRLALPADMRAGLGTGAVLTRSFDTCLCIYPAAKWESLAQAIDDLPQVRPEVRTLARALFGGAVPIEFDRQGRFVLPAFLREYAAIHADVVVVGVNSRVEIWDRAAWEEQRLRFETDGQVLAGALSAPLA